MYRDFLYVDDLADAIFKIYKLPKNQYKKLTKNVSHVNVGSGKTNLNKRYSNKNKRCSRL